MVRRICQSILIVGIAIAPVSGAEGGDPVAEKMIHIVRSSSSLTTALRDCSEIPGRLGKIEPFADIYQRLIASGFRLESGEPLLAEAPFADLVFRDRFHFDGFDDWELNVAIIGDPTNGFGGSLSRDAGLGFDEMMKGKRLPPKSLLGRLLRIPQVRRDIGEAVIDSIEVVYRDGRAPMDSTSQRRFEFRFLLNDRGRQRVLVYRAADHSRKPVLIPDPDDALKEKGKSPPTFWRDLNYVSGNSAGNERAPEPGAK